MTALILELNYTVEKLGQSQKDVVDLLKDYGYYLY